MFAFAGPSSTGPGLHYATKAAKCYATIILTTENGRRPSHELCFNGWFGRGLFRQVSLEVRTNTLDGQEVRTTKVLREALADENTWKAAATSPAKEEIEWQSVVFNEIVHFSPNIHPV